VRSAVALAALALAPTAAARELPAAWSNYPHAHRGDMRLVVVHVAEGTFGGTVSWFRNPRARASSHYVIGREGDVAHMVPDDQVAWHAGNGFVNRHSIGIEHEGYVGIDGTFTDVEYRTSARLVATLLRRYGLPADRRHLIGHDEVPDPFHHGRFGGWAHHTDPGRFWDWARYLGYVRSFRAGRVPPPPQLDVTLPGIGLGQTLTGVVALQPTAVGAAQVEVLVDGVPREGPDWDTSWEANGRHVISARAVGPDGQTALATVVVTTQNAPPAAPIVDFTYAETTVQPEVSGGPVVRVELWIDGVVVQTATMEPWTLTWAATPGPHTVAVRAVGPRGATAAKVVVVTIPAPPG
jgi:N-acetylmuramoyl-L-alanine amidase-like protein/Big-like domain-containing protein